MKVLKTIVCCFFSIGMLIGCSTTSSKNLTGPSPVDVTTADSKTTQANSALESALSSNPNLTTINVTTANNLYTEAIALNPANTQAQFGAAITELLTATQNQDFQTFVDSLQISSPSSTGLFKSSVIPININGKSVVSSEKIVLKLANATSNELPKISTLQKIVNDTVMPKINYALARLAIIESDPGFVFKITPKMRGDATSQDTFNLDNGEVFVIDAGLRIIQASMLALISYNVDVDMNGSYSWLQTTSNGFSGDSTKAAFLKQLLSSGSSFLTLNPWGQVSMQGVSSNLRTSLTKLTSAINEINAETHDQSHDIIKISDLNSANSSLANNGSSYNSITSVIDTIAKVLNGPYVFTKDSVSVTINFTAIFDHPIQDLKTKFPRYTWINPSQWRTLDTMFAYSSGIDGIYNGIDTSYDTTMAIPVMFQDANGVNISWDSLTFDKMYFPDYTFGGLFPNLTTKVAWDNLINSLNNSDINLFGSTTNPTPPSTSLNKSLPSVSNSYGIGVPLAKLFK